MLRKVTFLAAIFLAAFSAQAEKYKRCPNGCNADGEVQKVTVCTKCKGKGKTVCEHCKSQIKCKDCSGRGKIFQTDAKGKKIMEQCPVCKGAARVPASYVPPKNSAKK